MSLHVKREVVGAGEGARTETANKIFGDGADDGGGDGDDDPDDDVGGILTRAQEQKKTSAKDDTN